MAQEKWCIKEMQPTLLTVTLASHFKLWEYKNTSVVSLMMQMVYVDIGYNSYCNEWNTVFGLVMLKLLLLTSFIVWALQHVLVEM